jgi:hypothetical protein
MFTANDITPKLRKALDPLERALKCDRQTRLAIPRWAKEHDDQTRLALLNGRVGAERRSTGAEWANECVTGDPKRDARAHLDAKLAEALNRFGVFKGEEEEVKKRTAVVARKAPAPKKPKRA